ncbi:hypothetical protein BLOT_002674 [Blomia tropicalis]|nr:hypothetical protein BLOT_002674 [Blomia tropicalis]
MNRRQTLGQNIRIPTSRVVNSSNLSVRSNTFAQNRTQNQPICITRVLPSPQQQPNRPSLESSRTMMVGTRYSQESTVHFIPSSSGPVRQSHVEYTNMMYQFVPATYNFYFNGQLIFYIFVPCQPAYPLTSNIWNNQNGSPTVVQSIDPINVTIYDRSTRPANDGSIQMDS